MHINHKERVRMGVEQSVERLMMLRGTEVDPIIGALATSGSVERDGTITVPATEETAENEETSSQPNGDITTEETSAIAALRNRVSGAIKGVVDKIAS
jgi:hypothetical protein